MSYKTDSLVRLLPDAYAAKDTGSILYKLLDAFGAEFLRGDDKIKTLLKSHWVDYASGKALDGLGAIFGVSRRWLRRGGFEDDDAFRIRIKSIVPLFTGGGTIEAILGAVRSALGLPFHLDTLNLPPGFEELRRDIEKLVTIHEFSPEGQRLIGDTVIEAEGASELTLVVDMPTVKEDQLKILWTFTKGGGRRLSLECLDTGHGIKSTDALIVAEGKTLVLSTLPDGTLSAVVDYTDLSDKFTNLDGSTPAVIPKIPVQRSEWRFRAYGALFDISSFDESDGFDLCSFGVEMNWLRYKPLTFDIHVPYFIQEVVSDLIKLHKYPGDLNDLFVFEGLPLEQIRDVVNLTKAAGVRGNVYFSLNFLENHNHYEDTEHGFDHGFSMSGIHRTFEDARAIDELIIGSVDKELESHNINERFMIGGVLDKSTFDGIHVFV